MIFTHRRLFWLTVFLVMFQVVAFAQVETSNKKPSISKSDETAIQAIVTQYFNAFPKKDIAVITSLWGAKSLDFASRKQELEKLFAENENIVVKNITSQKLEIDGEKIKVRVVVELNATETKTAKPSEAFGSRNRFLNFVKEEGTWKIFREISAEKEFALRLFAMKKKDDRSQMLQDEKDLVNVNLTREITREGNRLYGQTTYLEAHDIYRLGLKIAEQIGDKNEILDAFNSIGLIQNNQGNRPEALEAYQKGLELSEEIGNKDMAARILGNIGQVYFAQDDYEKALSFYQRSFVLAEEVGNKRVVANALKNSGNVFFRTGNYPKALEYQQKSLTLTEQIGDVRVIASSLSVIGLVNIVLGNYPQAIDYLEKSVKLYESVGNKSGMALNQMNLGIVYLSKGDYAKAMTFYQESLSLGEEVGVPRLIMGVSVNIGNLYINQGNYQQALKFLNKALSIAESSKSRYGMITSLGNIASIYSNQGQYMKSIEYRQKALALAEETDNKYDIVVNLTAIGRNYFSLGDSARASEHFQKGLAVGELIGYNKIIFAVLLEIAKIQLFQKDYAKALETTEKAKLYYGKIAGVGDDETLYMTFGQAYRGLKNQEQARQSFDRSIAAIEKFRTEVAGGEQEQQRFFAKKISAYHLMVDFLISQNNSNEAFSFAERAKSRALLEALQNVKVDFTKSMSLQEKEEEQRSKYELIALNAQISKENERKQPEKTRLADLRKQLDNKRLASEDFQTRLYSSHPELKVQRGEMKPITVEETGALLPDAKSAMLEFVVAEDKTFLLVITKDAAKKVSLKAFTVDIKEKELGKRVEAYRSKIAGGDLDFQKASRELYDLLLKPAQAQLAGKTNLIIVPDGPLWDLPFQALQNEKNKYLVEQAAVSYAPSLTALKEMSKKARARKPDAGLELLAFGNPIVGKETAERVQRVFMSEKLEPLPESERLVNELGKMYGANRSKIFVGNQAREETAKTESPKYRIVQFATHGILNNVSPMYSHLVLSQNEKNPNEDGLLEAWEMKDLDLKADMVILSACETARGKISGGEGVIGMSWALFIAGTPTTIASQWKVEPASTTELMLEFHRQLLAKNKVSKAEALRRASLKVMKSPRYRHPLYWAGFVVIGDAS